jgi:hypothetical protein
LARFWLPRLILVGKAARDDEKRRNTRSPIILRRASMIGSLKSSNQLSAFEVFVTNITPQLTTLAEHAAFCALGSNNRSGGKEVTMTFGDRSNEKLKALLRSPLPPSQSTKVGQELADLVEIVSDGANAVNALRPEVEESVFQLSPLDECRSICDFSVVIIEKRRCIYAFDTCARACAHRSSGSGRFDVDALVNVLRNLFDHLSRPSECANEVEKGCELVVRRTCEGLANYVRDRGDTARLFAVCECADMVEEHMDEIVRQVAYLTPNADTVKEVVTEDIMGLESALFDEYLENIRVSVASSVRIGWLDMENSANESNAIAAAAPPSFPPYLSASLLAIVRCRAQVEQALGNRIRRSSPTEVTGDHNNVPYQHLAMRTVADAVVEGICSEVMRHKFQLKVRQADRLANELEFLKASLKRFLSEKEGLATIDQTLHVVNSKAGRDRNYKGGDGPDGLAALEELERLGRVYVLCLGQ